MPLSAVRISSSVKSVGYADAAGAPGAPVHHWKWAALSSASGFPFTGNSKYSPRQNQVLWQPRNGNLTFNRSSNRRVPMSVWRPRVPGRLLRPRAYSPLA